MASAVQLLGDEYLIDSHDLRSGEDWQQRIGELIDDADVFQLFWSSNALQSHYVLAECRHALALRREGFIRPVYWQDPLPEDPTQDLPPTPIRRLHFSRLAATACRPLLRRPRSRRPRRPLLPAAALPRLFHRRPAEHGRVSAIEPARSTPGHLGGGRRGGDRRRRRRRRRPPGRRPRRRQQRSGDNQGSRRPAAAHDQRPASTTEPVSSDDAAFDRAVAYLGGQAVAQDPSCQLSAGDPALGEVGAFEEVGVDCTLTAASGASVDFRSVVLRPGVTVQQYLDGLAAAPGLQVVGASLPSDPDGPYLDIGGRLPDGRTYSCRAWGQPPVAADTNAIAIACSGSMADVVDFWRRPPMTAEGVDRGPHRLQVGRAAIAFGQVAFEAVAVGQRALEVVRHELDRLPAGEPADPRS